MRPTRLPALLCGALLLTFIGCGDDVPQDEQARDTTQASGPKEVRIVKGESGSAPDGVKLIVKSPGPDEVVTADSVRVSVDLQGFNLASPTEGGGSSCAACSYGCLKKDRPCSPSAEKSRLRMKA